MADRLVLHIGSMKSGTSFIQNVLGDHKDQLLDQGVLFAGPRWKAQVAAVQELIGHGGPKQEPFAEDGPYRRLEREINAYDGTAVISMEFLGPRSTVKIQQLQEAFPDTKIDVVMTCRDLARNIPAMWLESVQNGSTVGWSTFLSSVRAEERRPGPGRNFWRHQAIPAIARRWATEVGVDHLTLVTVPQPGAEPGLLWSRFAEVLGVEYAGWDLTVRANPSIGLATALVLQRLNVEMQRDDGTLPRSYDAYVKHKLAKRGLAQRGREDPKLGLDEEWVMTRGRSQVKRLESAGYRVVGDLDELNPRLVPGVHADEVTAEDQLAAAVGGMGHLVGQWAKSDRQNRRKLREARK